MSISKPIYAALHHVSQYQYAHPVSLGPQIVRLRPAPHCRSLIVSYALKVEPAHHFINWYQDHLANYLARLVFTDKVSEFKVTVDMVIQMSAYNPFDFFLEPGAERYPFAYNPIVKQELASYLQAEPLTEATPLLQAYLHKINRNNQATIDFLVYLNQTVHHDLAYLTRMEPGVQSPEHTLATARGSCRDSAWLLVQLLRHCGLAARFVSGYLIELSPNLTLPNADNDAPRDSAADSTELHAWCEVYLPGAGWIGLDTTSGLMAGDGHIPLACSPQPSSAAPIEGATEKTDVIFSHQMQVTRLPKFPI